MISYNKNGCISYGRVRMSGKTKKAPGIFLLLLICIPSFLLAQEVTSPYLLEPRKIDGQLDDWESVPFIPLKKGTIEFCVANDENYLYLALRVIGPERALRETDLSGLLTGITIYLSSADKKNKDKGFYFVPRRLSPEEAIEEIERSGGQLSREQKDRMRLAKFITFYDGEPVGKEIKTILSANRGQRFEKAIFRLNSTKEYLMYEFRIPFKPADNMEPLLKPGENFMLGFEWGGQAVDLPLLQYLQMELIKLWSWAPEGQILPELGTQLTDLPTKARFRKMNYWKPVKLAAEGN